MITLAQHPTACPGCYSLHLYCKFENPAHAWNEFPWQLDQFQTYAEAARHARSRGWKLHRDGLATCPKCIKEKPAPDILAEIDRLTAEAGA